jgi:plastocyanin
LYLTRRGQKMRNPIHSTAVGVTLISVVVALIAAGGGLAMAAPTKTIKLEDNFFAPSTMTAKRGTTVRFEWAGNNPHNVVKASGPGPRFASRTAWRRGVNFAKKFKKVGTYRLICTLHSGMELNLKVVR